VGKVIGGPRRREEFEKWKRGTMKERRVGRIGKGNQVGQKGENIEKLDQEGDEGGNEWN